MIVGNLNKKISLKWIITKCSTFFLQNNPQYYLESPKYYDEVFAWNLKFYPTGHPEKNVQFPTITLELSVCLEDIEIIPSNYSLHVELEFAFLTEKTKVIDKVATNSKYIPVIVNGEVCKTKLTFELNKNCTDLIQELVDDKIFITCNISKNEYGNKIYQNVNELIKARKKNKGEFNEKNLKTGAIAIDFVRSFFNKEMFSDIKIVCKDATFFAHKMILCMKSSVLMNWIQSDSKIKETNIIEMKEVKEYVMKEVLQYIYFEDIENLEVFAIEVLPVAHKLKINDLTKQCEEILVKSIEVHNAISMLLNAEKYKINKLKNAAIKLIVLNINSLSKSDDWSLLSSDVLTKILVFACNNISLK